ncbi:MAG: 30S ribosomal protein S12 methylthiotransferase RimO [Gemmatimonadota bacterium]
MKLGLVSLGCDKNTVDSERMLAALVGEGAEPTEDPREADILLVNTCGFIDAAKQESIDTLIDLGRWKDEGRCRALVAVGCLVERYRPELERELGEVDLFLGLSDLPRLVPELKARGLLDGGGEEHPGTRLPLGRLRHVSYLKVSEGCDHGCAFCAIPLWRGRHRSFEPEALVEEAARLEARGVVELNLVAQDLAHFGRDRRDGTDITALLRRLLEGTEIPWFRLLYIYSAGIREPLVELMAAEPRVLPYLDMPIQHASDPVLERMRRPERQDRLRAKIRWLRDSIPGLTLRTTVMVGFPGETEADFRALLDFLEEVRFDRLGAFAFSRQPGTRAEALRAQAVPEAVGRERLEELLEVQRSISSDRLGREVGRRCQVLVDRDGEDGEGPFAECSGLVGRTTGQADDVDGLTWLESDVRLAPGTLVEAEVTAAHDFDLAARLLGVTREAPRPPPAAGSRRRGSGSGRRLPVLGLETARGR